MLTYGNNLVGIDPITRSLIAVPAEDNLSLRELLDLYGFVIVRGLLSAAAIRSLLDGLSREKLDRWCDPQAARARHGAIFARRNLLDVPAVADLVASPALGEVVLAILGERARAVRGILFDKTPDANWLVPWHQDLSIAVRERLDV